MKFLCVECDERMEFSGRESPGDGTLAAEFRCPACGRSVAMLTNPMETDLVSSLGVEIGGRTVPAGPFDTIESVVPDATGGPGDTRGRAPVRWSPEAVERLAGVPRFVRGMVKRIYADWAKERGIREITPDVMDRARSDLGLEGM